MVTLTFTDLFIFVHSRLWHGTSASFHVSNSSLPYLDLQINIFGCHASWQEYCQGSAQLPNLLKAAYLVQLAWLAVFVHLVVVLVPSLLTPRLTGDQNPSQDDRSQIHIFKFLSFQTSHHSSPSREFSFTFPPNAFQHLQVSGSEECTE